MDAWNEEEADIYTDLVLYFKFLEGTVSYVSSVRVLCANLYVLKCPKNAASVFR